VTGAEFVQRLRRADLVDGLGIYVGPSAIALAHLRKRMLRVSVESTAVVPLPKASEGPARQQAVLAALRGFVQEHRIDTRRTSLVLPRSFAMFNRVLLPAAASENLAQVLEYELENLIPIPRDEVHYDFSWRPHGEERIEVLLMCLPRVVIREYLDLLAQADVRPRRIVLASVTLAEYVAFCENRSGGVTGFVVGEGEDVEVALVRDGRLLTSQLVPAARLEAQGGLERCLTRLLDEEQVAEDDLTLYGWGTNGTATRLPFTELPCAPPGRLDGDAMVAPDLLPAVGAALGAVREGSVPVNLLPAEERRGTEEGISLATLALVGLMALLLVVWGASALIKDQLLLRTVNAQVVEMQPRIEEVRRLQDEIASLQSQIEILSEGDDFQATELVRELTELIPTDAYLTTLTLREGRVTMDGHAKSASDIITALDKAKRFKKVRFSSPTTRAGDRERFALVAEVAR